ncbi:hypothetical protein [Paenibacillus sp.]|uniref:hypothetical protein n=1 Tax=Paenibacillus sp. TaxID=58172 RepID=UPI0028121D52|nr:hypothetical protein [Paenibacillus sp.]
MKSFIYMIIFLVLFQIGLPLIYPSAHVIGYRVDYQTVRDNLYMYDAVLEQIRKEVRAHPEKEVVILLGDSVAYSGPVSSDESIGYYLKSMTENEEEPPLIYNLALPSFQAGDIYTMLLKLEEYGIPREHVAINVRYAGFTRRDPGAAIVFWLKDELRRLDPRAFERSLPQLVATGYRPPETALEKIQDFFVNRVYPRIAMYRYKEFVKQDILRFVPGNPEKSDTLGDPRPWYEKPKLPELLKQRQYTDAMRDEPFDMTESSLQIYFLEKIIDLQRGKQTLFFLTGVNTELMERYVTKPGYQANLKSIDAYFAGKPVQYVNLHGRIPNDLFTDHTHFTSEGYRQIADAVWKLMSKGGNR